MDKEKIELQLKFTPNYKKYSILLNCYRVGGMKWNDVDGAIFYKIDLSKEDVLFALGVKQQIVDIESKLAEGEKTEDGAFWFEEWQHKKRDYDSVYKAYIENCAEVDQLKQQLAEKEKEETKRMEDFEKECQEYYKSNQTAIAELEKVKDYNRGLVYSSSLIDKFIDQQIAELKGEK